MEVIDRQIELAQEEVIKTKKKYDAATDNLKNLLDKKKELQTEELMAAVMKSNHTYEDILRSIKNR
jgi:formiminotetrahydrofolate cyclodeaminase